MDLADISKLKIISLSGASSAGTATVFVHVYDVEDIVYAIGRRSKSLYALNDLWDYFAGGTAMTQIVEYSNDLKRIGYLASSVYSGDFYETHFWIR